MSKRYPPIFNVILFAVAVYIIVINPMTMPMPWISAITSFIVFAISSIFNAAADDDYAHFWYVNADWSDTCLLQSRLNSYLETEKRSG